MAAAGSSVAELLNAAQDSAAACERCATGLWKLILHDPDPSFAELTECVDLLLTVSQKSPNVDRCIKFVGVFVRKAPPNSEVASAVAEELLTHLSGHLSAADKVVRFHACQVLQQVLSQLPEHLLLDEGVLDALTNALLERLQDKLPGIRAEAVRALCHLLTDAEDSDDSVEAVVALLEGDKSKDVRVAVVQSLPLTTSTLPVLLHRAKDVNPVVRKALVLRLKGLSIKVLSIQQRASATQQLLQDRDSSVAEAAARMLAHWLEQDCGGDPLVLLQLLDVETYTDAAACALESLISSNSIQVLGQQSPGPQASIISYVKAAAAAPAAAAGAGGGVGLSSLRGLCKQQGRLLQAHEALLWRCLCEWLQTDAISRGLAAAATGGARAAVHAAVAAERHEALEEVLPETADELMELVMRHAAAGPAARFAAAQLLMIGASCMEWTDAASRDSAAPFLQQLISLDPLREGAEAAAGNTAAAIQGSSRGAQRRSRRGAAATADGGDADGESDDDDGDDTAGLQLAGNGGDGMFEGAVVQLVRALHGTGGGAAGLRAAMLDGVAGLATAAGLLIKPASSSSSSSCAADEAPQQAVFTVGAADSSQVLQVLCFIRLLLQQLPISRHNRGEAADLLASGGSSSTSSCVIISFDSLWELLLLLALKQEHTHVRAKAVECIGLYAVVSAAHNPSLLTSAVSLLGPLLAAEGSALVRAAAARALVDIALLFGPAAVDAVLLRPTAAAGTAGGDGLEGGAGAGAVDGNKGLLELLMLQAEMLLAEAQDAAAAAASSKAKGRRGGKSSSAARTRQAPEDSSSDGVLSASAAELMAVVAEALAKLLLHQRAWLRQYARRTVLLPNAHSPAAAAATPGTDPAAATVAAAAAAAAADGAAVVQPVQLPPDSQQQQLRLLQRALGLLLQLQFHPATATVTQVCQCLSVFFDVFSAASEGNRLQLAAACLPAAHQALNVTSTKKHPAPLLVKYVLQLLQQANLRREQQQQQQQGLAAAAVESPLGESYCSVARLMLGEVTLVGPITVGAGHQPAKYKPYLSTLLKVVCELPLDFSQQQQSNSSSTMQDLAELQSLTHNLSVITTDSTLNKDVAALQQHLQQLGDAAAAAAGDGNHLQQQQQQLTEDAVEALVQQVCSLSLQQLPPLPGSLAEAAAAAAGGGALRGGAATRTASGSRSRSSSTAAAAAATVARGGRGRQSAAAAGRKSAASAAAAAQSGRDDSSSDAESDSAAGGSSEEEEEEQPAAAARSRPSAARGAGASGRAAAAAAGGSRTRATAAAKAAVESDSDLTDDSDNDDDDGGAVVDADNVHGAAAAAAAAAAAGSSSDDDDDDNSDGSGTEAASDDDDEDEEPQPPTTTTSTAPTAGAAAANKGTKGGPARGTKAAAAAAAARGRAPTSRRQPLAPSSADNRTTTTSRH